MDLHNVVGEGRVVPVGTGTFCFSELLQQLPIFLFCSLKLEGEMKSKEVQEEKVSPWRNQSAPSGGSGEGTGDLTTCLPFLTVWPSEQLGPKGVAHHNILHPLGPHGAPSTLCSVQKALAAQKED